MKKLLIVLGLLIAVGYYLIFGISLDLPVADINKGENAIWLKHQWVGEQMTPRDIQVLGKTLAEHDIKYTYVHSGPFEKDGTVSPDRYPFASYFLHNLALHNKSAVPLAWLGQLRSKLDISDPDIRWQIASTVQYFVHDLGFAGVHINIEPIPDFDEDFVALLHEIREAIGPDRILSVAVDEWQPSIITKAVNHFHPEPSVSYVSGGYIEQIGEIADQIVIMTYDTGFDSAGFYTWFVEQQVIYGTKHAGAAHAFIGIPVYDEPVEGSFDPSVENIETGMRGVVNGLNNMRTDIERFGGVALYSNAEINEEEWSVYKAHFQQ